MTTVISSLGWVEGDALWRFDVPTSTNDRVPLETGARWTSLHSSGTHYFSTAHHFDGKQFQVTVRTFAAPDRVVARAVVGESGNELSGEASAWSNVPRLYAEYLGYPPWKDSVLVRIIPSTGSIDIQRLDWYQDYDKVYQGLVDALELPGKDLALISVQRSSRLILHDLKSGARKRDVDLGNRYGNPKLFLRNEGREIWAGDYDTLVVV